MAMYRGYADMLGQGVFEETPKEVWAAIALSYASTGGDLEPAGTAYNILREWEILVLNQLVAQRPGRKLRALASGDARPKELP